MTPGRCAHLLLLAAVVACGDSAGTGTTSGGTSGGSTEGTGGVTSAATSETGSTGGSGGGSGGTGGVTGTTGTTGESTSTGETSAGTTGDSQIAKDCAAGVTASDELDTYLCGCKVMAGMFPDVKSCLASMPADIDPGCRCSVYAQHPEDGELVACLADALAAYVACVQPTMCEDQAIESCVESYFEALGPCGDFSSATLAAIEIECKMVPAHKCGSGEAIPETWVCDGVADCVDMSDEADCFFMCQFSGEIFPKSYQCDGVEDCMDGTDEKLCP